ncbi:MAG: GAK system CofD-like protein [Desulfococcaceae bacterium]
MEIHIRRRVRLPDPLALERHRRAPDLGPRVLFFSGGTALRDVSRELTGYTHNSVHVITPFDSGGSSALLREAFHMPAIGDVRNRLLALADRSLKGNPEIFRLFAQRFPADADPGELAEELDRMIRGRHPLVSDIPDPMRKIIRHHLDLFRNYMPMSFDLRKASLGNLILTAGYLDNRRNFDIIIYIFSKLVRVLGVVRPVINKYLHLAAELADGRTVVGQHLLTGKETDPIAARVERLYLTDNREAPRPVEAPIRAKMHKQIGKADLICYPIGSFYSSVVANLLPEGVGRAVQAADCPKVFVPNTGERDPEAVGMTLTDLVDRLLIYLRRDDPAAISAADVLNFVLVDSERGNYPGGVDRKALESRGVTVLDAPLVDERRAPDIDPALLVSILLSLA